MRADRTSGAGRLELVVLLGDEVAVHALPESGQVTIGRAPDNDVPVDDGSVSRRHAILHIGSPLRIEDLGSANGTWVRSVGEPAGRPDTHQLRRSPGESFDVAPGDRIVLGATIAVVRRRRGSAPGRGGDGRAAPSVVVQSEAMRALYEDARRAAQGAISVLCLGETGVGKEVLAREIHARSPRAGGPFVAIHCASLPESLLEGELFGYERGAFTGAGSARPGLFEAADGGTAFLDEVGELPLPVQVKLLRVLEERAVLRVGARSPRRVDIRFISATNRDLEAEVKRGAFRQDLFFRLNGLALTIPPLRERIVDVRHLAALFLEEACREIDLAPAPALSEEVLGLLERHDWPGNVRELRNAIERAVLLCDGAAISAAHLPSPIGARGSGSFPKPGAVTAPPPAESMEELRAAMEELDRRRLIEALEKSAGNQTRAAELLGISRRTLVTKISLYKLPRPRKRS